MRILGVDPGTARVGWAIIETEKNKIVPIAYGCITTEKFQNPQSRLLAIHTLLLTVLDKYKPQELSVEDLFFASNAKTAISVGQARGVILLAAAQKQIPVVSYTPLVVKQVICGHGRADKLQVQKMVTKLLALAAVPKPDDAADALAIAMTHAYSYKFKKITR